VAAWRVLHERRAAPARGCAAYAVAYLPASFSSVGLLLQPVAAASFAWLLFGESLAALQWLGAAAGLAGIWLARGGTQ